MKKKRKKIIVACDCSDYSAEIFDYAVQMARGLGSDIIVANVINKIALDHIERAMSMYAAFDLKEYVAGLKSDRQEMIRKLIQSTGHADLFKKVIIKTGVPFQKLLETIAEENADLIVMGNKGRGNLVGVMLGSCAEKLFRRCPIALLSVRVGKEKRRLATQS